mmetsp:Transcript_104888/g.273765  ORF Transcript_104888/g.273765 Transcript_104888/m.273765 type:complete len:188 (-) Transcript_104888:160-723(-)
MENLHAGINTCTPSDRSTNACADRFSNCQADCSTDSCTDRFPDRCTDSRTDSITDRFSNSSTTDSRTDISTDRIPNSNTDSFAVSCADSCADRCADARLCAHVVGHLRCVHARRRMCTERELSAAVWQQPDVHDYDRRVERRTDRRRGLQCRIVLRLHHDRRMESIYWNFGSVWVHPFIQYYVVVRL